MGCLSVVLMAGVVSGPALGLCLSLPFWSSSLLGLHLFFKLSWPAPVLPIGVAWSWAAAVFLSWGQGHSSGREWQWGRMEVWGHGMGLWEWNLGSGRV